MNDQWIREIKPVYVPAQFLIWGILGSGFISIFPGFFTFVISNIIGAIASDHLFDGPVVIYGATAYVLSFLACMYLIHLKMKNLLPYMMPKFCTWIIISVCS